MLGSAIPNYLDAPDASREVRLSAAILDELLTLGIPALMGLYAFWLGGETYPMSWVSTVWSMVMVLSQVMLLTFYGKSIGKIVFGTTIVLTSTGENGGFIANVLLRNIISRLLSIIPFYFFIDHFLIFRKDQRCVHDWIADTRVVQIRVPKFGFARFMNVGCLSTALVISVGLTPTGLGNNMRAAVGKWQISILINHAERLVLKTRLKDGFEHPNVAMKLGELGDLYLMNRQYNDAIKAWDEGMRLAADAGGLYQNDAIDSARKIGYVYLITKDYETARTNLEYALALIATPSQVKQQFASSEPWISSGVMVHPLKGNDLRLNPLFAHTNCLTLMGRLMAETNNWQEAESYYSTALSLMERSVFFQEGDISFIDPLVGLAGVHIRRRRYADARALIERAEKISKQLNPMQWEVAEVLKAQAEYYEAVNEFDQAIEYAKQAMKVVMQGKSSSDNPDVRRFTDTLNRIEMRR